MAEKQPSEKPVSWEIVSADQLRPLLLVTIGDTLTQQLAAVIGFTKLATSIDPIDTPGTNEYTKQAEEAAQAAASQLRAIQQVLRQNEEVLIPVDRTTYPDRPIIMLDKVPLPKPNPST